MKLNGMSAAITEGRIIDTRTMLSAMTDAEKRRLIAEAQASLDNFARLVRINKDMNQC